jgi:hypothetical protein
LSHRGSLKTKSGQQAKILTTMFDRYHINNSGINQGGMTKEVNNILLSLYRIPIEHLQTQCLLGPRSSGILIMKKSLLLGCLSD